MSSPEWREAVADLIKLKDAMRLAYGLLWHMEIDREDDNLRLASDARKTLCEALSKDDRCQGIVQAKGTDGRFTGAA